VIGNIDREETPIDVATGVHPDGLIAPMAAIKAVSAEPEGSPLQSLVAPSDPATSRIVITMSWGHAVLDRPGRPCSSTSRGKPAKRQFAVSDYLPLRNGPRLSFPGSVLDQL